MSPGSEPLHRAPPTNRLNRGLDRCLHASKCGRLCRWLVKGPGLHDVWCCHPKLDKPLKLYKALEEFGLKCPERKAASAPTDEEKRNPDPEAEGGLPA
jgi:hypothetical protein